MRYVLSFFGLVLILLCVRGFLVGVRRKKEMQEAACVDYMGFKRDIKAWFADRENEALRRKADAAMQAINHCVKVMTFTRSGDVKTAKQAALYTYAKELKTLYDIDVEYNFSSPTDFGDPIFRDAVHEYCSPTQQEVPKSSSSLPRASDKVESR